VASRSGAHRDPDPGRVVKTVLVPLASITAASAQPLPQLKVGQCPSGYHESGGYCAPTSDRAPAACQRSGMPVGMGAERRLLPGRKAALIAGLSGARVAPATH
jgi:hypothetical protein